VQGPVAAETDEDVFAVIVRVTIPERGVIAPAVAQREMIPGPDCSMVRSVVIVPVNVVVVIRVPY